MKHLWISTNQSLPPEAQTGTLVVYGGKGMGKTNFLAVLCEEFDKTGLKFSLLDPLGVNWGLQYGRTRDLPGLKVLILGGIHGDIAILPTAGAVVADLVVDESISTVIDISRRPNGQSWSMGEKIKFTTDYCNRLYERQGEKRRPIMQIIDEAGRFVPQTMPKGAMDIAMCVGAIEQMVEWGRNVGIGTTLVTQRSARMAKNVSELADAMIAFRTVGPNSVDAIMGWMSENIEKEKAKILVDQVRTLERGSALIVSPGWLKVEHVVPIRFRETFDSSATPKAGTEVHAPGRATKPDLEKYKSRMIETEERAKADDPKELRREILSLKKEIVALKQSKPEVITTPAPPLLTEEDRKLLNETIEILKGFRRDSASIDSLLDHVTILCERVTKTQQAAAPPLAKTRNSIPVRPAPAVTNPARTVTQKPKTVTQSDGTISDGTQQRTVDTIAMLNSRGIDVTREAVARWMGIHPNGGRFLSGLASLRANGFMDGWSLTSEGHAAAREMNTGIDAAVAAIKDGTCRRSFEELVSVQPKALSREELAGRMGIHPNGGRFLSGLSWLRQMGLITERSPIAVTDGAFQ